jgi:hypothetical protein
MSKNHQHKKQSKASKKRQNKKRQQAGANHPKVWVNGRSNVHQADIREILEYPSLHKAAHAFPIGSLGSKDKPGALAISLASYLGELKDRLMGGDEIPKNLFLQFGYSHLPMQGFEDSNTLYARDGINIPLMKVIVPDGETVCALAVIIEGWVRDTAARISEHSDKSMQSVIVVVDETHEERDPSSAFGIPEDLSDPNFHMENIVTEPC